MSACTVVALCCREDRGTQLALDLVPGVSLMLQPLRVGDAVFNLVVPDVDAVMDAYIAAGDSGFLSLTLANHSTYGNPASQVEPCSDAGAFAVLRLHSRLARLLCAGFAHRFGSPRNPIATLQSRTD